MPDAQIGADVIVGFPGESEKDFEETVRLLESLPIHYLHVFPYSPRPGTESSKYRDDVSTGTKKERVSRLLRMDVRKRSVFLQSQVGKELEILVESANSIRGELSGYSGNYVKVFFPGDIGEIGNLTRVGTDSIHGKGLYGRREGGNA
jgi:threonylcarbamoyladenosine tRNA methylthiotransferase MtaB